MTTHDKIIAHLMDALDTIDRAAMNGKSAPDLSARSTRSRFYSGHLTASTTKYEYLSRTQSRWLSRSEAGGGALMGTGYKRPSWREHFSGPAGDLLALQAAFLGPDWLKDALMRCFRRSKGDRKINERTVCAVLSEMGEDELSR